MEDKISRRAFLKKVRNLTIATATTGFAGHTYVKYIEPRWIEVTRQIISHSLIPHTFNNFKIVQFSDTHLGFHFNFDQLEKVITLILQEKPDLIIFSGDLVDNLLSFFEYEETIAFLSQLTAPYGKFAVYGNHDHGGWGTEKYRQIMEASNFTLLVNETHPIYIGKDQIYLAGIDEPILGKPDFTVMFNNSLNEAFTLLISHAPDLADEATKYSVHYQISGHTHGGQVQMPFFGPLITPPYGQKYVEGYYSLTDDFTLYVNRGLGTTRLPYRLLSRPEITIYTIES